MASVALLLALAVSNALAQTGQAGASGSSGTTGGATQAAPTFNPNSSPNPNPTSSPTNNPIGNPPSPVGGSTPTNPAGSAVSPVTPITGQPTPGQSTTGQTNTNTPLGAPATSPAGSPATTPAGSAAALPGSPAGATIGMNQSGALNNSTQVFTQLDPGRKGYLSTADVASNQFLATNFQRCDTNGDGRLTQAETSLCLQSAPPSQQ